MADSSRAPSSVLLRASSSDELLAAVNVEGRAGERRIRHEVDGQCGDVGRADDTADRQCGTKLFAARVQIVAEERRRQGCVDESGRDQVHADRCDFECEVFGQGGQRRCER